MPATAFLSGITEPIRSRLQFTFNGQRTGTPAWVSDLATGEDPGFFGPGSAVWAVHGGMSTIPAGVRALLVQALHPGALAGVHDHSRYREDPSVVSPEPSAGSSPSRTAAARQRPRPRTGCCVCTRR
ncbi:hypothetical protein GCM10025867_21560 [Frondihabitans sucicola]|uniref:ER-bound oxygenase mpaB/mpaB'/Rubber oxygenase catalytic domain-containing protein n=1 Tax=Frondihabitans sucicola TaxID=1268041 RepID=A0ABM8GNA1_9MICO|nr:hypothetical protein GCM10025867_21560 [Frondihabitans sucicola]